MLDRCYLSEGMPTLLIWGGRDAIIPVDQARMVHAAMPGSRLEIFDDAGHFPHHTDPAALPLGAPRVHGHHRAGQLQRRPVAHAAAHRARDARPRHHAGRDAGRRAGPHRRRHDGRLSGQRAGQLIPTASRSASTGEDSNSARNAPNAASNSAWSPVFATVSTLA